MRIDGLCQRSYDLPSLCLGLFARLSEHFSGGADGKLKIYGVLDCFSDQHRASTRLKVISP